MSRQAEILVMWWISLVAQKALGQSARVISRPHQEVHGGAASPIHGIDVLAAASGTSVDDDTMMDVRVSAAYGEVHSQSIAGVNIMEWTGHAIRFQAPVDAAPVVLSQLEYLPCQHCSNDTLSVSCSKRVREPPWIHMSICPPCLFTICLLSQVCRLFGGLCCTLSHSSAPTWG
ncbi:unnamed protein product [Vitrella brassicaformis CCMP3155]|uniref:Uncharacterized protein n=1 Tax=Vitrella brassicaformis (strain CCMP3155) TaxID=1169540 RepID=A0A0G4H3H8_VITBC|nr:unnamed protein product [Vitrella brassicaformis CCMP3155]|mmetsp:Transcript_33320/g.82554  ORF Transcript_33320/g.82554 Transcript_33320/m.82554 type:complete len:174 (-) Transcript_33320:483-1004(-)|eukprot:CEM38259.1 unnamed protein product [Vitrella brassicaformis CCMP3155]